MSTVFAMLCRRGSKGGKRGVGGGDKDDDGTGHPLGISIVGGHPVK